MSEWTRRRFLGVAAAGLTGSIAGCTRPTGGEIDGWPLWRRDPGRTGYSPAVTGPLAGRLAWTIRPDEAAGPAVADGGTVVTGGSSVTAIDGVTGRIRWHHPMFFSTRESPAIAGGKVYAVGRSTFLSLDANGGRREWFESNDIWRYHAPVVAHARLFVAMTKVKYSTAFDARVVAFDLQGNVEWRSPVGSNVLPPFAVAVDGDRVYAGRDQIYALDARTGGRVWTFDDPAVSAFANPVVAEETVYAAATIRTDGVPTGILFALDAEVGTERWRVETGLSPTPPAVTPDGLYLAADRVLALDHRGRERWEYGGNQFVTASPSVAGDTVYLGGIDGRVVALDADDGERRWTRATPGSLLFSPAIIGERMYLSSADGYLLAFDR